MRRVAQRCLIVAILAAGIAVASAGVAWADVFQFKLGFKVLADQIPQVVGQPLQNEHYTADGDALQQTTGGLLVWRKADNSTAFTNGAVTWVNGPQGLQERGNKERFDWERTVRVSTTNVITFRPAGIRGLEQVGYCWTESLASGQPDAWRCMAGNSIYDPCFTIAGETGAVACGASPTGDPYAFRLKLTRPLPERTAPAIDRPWMVELADDVVCGYLTGASTGVGGERANYGCTDGWYILGDPRPGHVWMADEAQIAMTRQGPALLDSAEVNLKTVWR